MNLNAITLTIDPKNPGDLIRILRAAKNWSRQTLAEEAGVSEFTILRIENGITRRPQKATILRLVLVMGYDISMNVTVDEPTPEPEQEPVHD